MTIDGTKDALPAKGRHITVGARVTVTLSSPIDTKEFRRRERDRLMAAVRSAIEAHLPVQPSSARP